MLEPFYFDRIIVFLNFFIKNIDVDQKYYIHKVQLLFTRFQPISE